MTSQKLAALVATALCFQALVATELQATVILVPSDQPTIQAGIDVALAGDTVLVAPGTYTGPDNTELNFLGKDLVLMGAGVGITTLDCLDHGDPVIRFENGETRAAVLRDMTLQNNYNFTQSPGIDIDGASPTLSNLHLDDFRARSGDETWNYYTGAALHCLNGSPLVSSVTVSNCRGAGGIYVRYGEPEFLNVTVSGGSIGYASGGGFYLRETTATLHDVSIINCEAFEGGGGGVVCVGTPAPTFKNCRFEGNEAYSETGGGSGGGGLACFGSSPVLMDCEFLDNDARDGGGGLACYDGSDPMLAYCIFEGNSAGEFGTAVLAFQSSPAFANVTVTDSRSSFWGPAIAAIYCADQSSPQLSKAIVAFSEASYGFWTDASSVPSLYCCDVFGNELGPFGGDMPNLLGVDGNFAINPLFCREQGGEALTLAAGSPCLPANNSCAELIGARDQGCDYPAFWIAGRTAYADDSPLGDVLLDGLPGYARTDESGQYAELVPSLGPVTVRPMFSGHAFIPEERHYEILDADQFVQNYTGQIVQLVRVPEDYTDIATAIAYVESGDTILVSPGTYSGPGFHELRFGGKDIVLMSSHGAELTIIEEVERYEIIHFTAGETRAARMQGFTLRHLNRYDPAINVSNSSPTLADLVVAGFGDEGGPGLELSGPNSDALVLDSVFYGNRAYSDGGAIRCQQGTLTLERVTIARNYAHDSGGGIRAGYGATLNLTHCIVAYNQGGGISAVGDLTVNLDCNDFYANPGGDFVDLPTEPTGLASTISADPVFCNPLAGIFTLHDSSPCAAANSPCGLRLGALGTDCSQPVVAIAGAIAGPGGEALNDVLLAGLALPHLSDSLGGYRAIVDAGFSGTVRPLLPGHGFAPRARNYDAIATDQLDQDYSGFVETMHRVPADYPDIQTALDVCAEGDTVLLAPGIYTGAGNTDLIIDRVNLTLKSESGPEVTLIDGEGEHHGLLLDGSSIGTSSLLEGITIQNCVAQYHGGAIRLRYGSPRLKDMILRSNSAPGDGGGLKTDGASLLLEGVQFLNNSAGSSGGALDLFKCEATIRGCTFSGNHAEHGGGAVSSYEGGSDPVEVLIENCTFFDNRAESKGGVLYTNAGENIGWGRMPRLRANIFAENSAVEGGAIYTRWSVTDSTRIECNDFHANVPDNFGGWLGDQVGVTGNFEADPRFCDPESGDLTLAANSPCLPNANSCRLTVGAFGEGCLAVSIPEEDLPLAFALSPAYPNPFNPRTEIAFDLPEPTAVDLAIYDVNGRQVATLLDARPHDAGRHRVSWTGRDSNGRRLASGVYLLRLRAGRHSAESKLVLLK